MRPVDWKELVELCESFGCKFDRHRGDHYIMVKDGLFRPIVIPTKKGLKEDIVLGIGRTLGINRKQLEQHLAGKKKKRGK